MRVACIGSREIPTETALLMQQIGEMLAQKGHSVASGNAMGSDEAYARGANQVDPKRVLLYLPWASYNKELIVQGNEIHLEEAKEWEPLAEKHHPAWMWLSQGARRMMIRNVGIVMQSDRVIAYLNHNKTGGGGTGHGWRVAGALKIPRIDLSVKQYTLEEIKQFIQGSTDGKDETE